MNDRSGSANLDHDSAITDKPFSYWEAYFSYRGTRMVTTLLCILPPKGEKGNTK
jgi:hypothetical protein